ncbi:imidazole glycerol phosphate synthase subunit HisH [Bifidobacterium callimiconis]|uniref:Imidazole glycerol phosphate synthase subunit HisH n=2 Tax=Bifidobacterium callimiconis TaxID=2306973 RepID=A0A430FFF0_9BIFI|nr:imidazole glycerol phosphate synthase subunit HisH [Bifidobacterium callimiconis]MBT1176152.1 imidazole glycerol phosphate synthase subunit HisH [Bifidobacterium callimiconis]RSX51501.1 imidazole glycerol phosphate synthase subunit HisH [Bifidobacterium callimiconis]
MTSVVVFDYGFGNVRSMVRALANLDIDVTLTSDYKQAMEADGLVVPGVGAFAACVEGLKTVGGDRVVRERLEAGRPVLGVCVGLQVMFESGVEGGTPADGLGYIGGVVESLDADVVPHMGWNTVDAAEGSTLLHGLENERFYFVHSYAVSHPTPDGVNASVIAGNPDTKFTWCEYGRSRFVAAVEKGALSATQFHPEKSADAGAQLLRNWIATF